MPKKSLPKEKVLVEFIQDRSGSMSTVWKETLSGFKSFVDDLKKNKDVQYTFGLTVFDDRVERPFCGQLDTMNPEILAHHPPRNWTAIYDAVARVLHEAPDAEFDKVICVVVTDGGENASRVMSKWQLHEIVDAKINTGKWTFQYLGTQPETWGDAAGIGISLNATAVYASGNIHNTYAAMSSAVNNLSADRGVRSSTNMMAFADGELLKAASLKHRP